MKNTALTLVSILTLSQVGAYPLYEVDFTAAEGFSEGAGITSVNGMAAQGGWVAEDVNGRGWAAASSAWNRAEHYTAYTLDVGHSIVIETTLRLTDDNGIFNDSESFMVGFAEESLHSGNSIPSIGSKIWTLASGGYRFGDATSDTRLEIAPSAAGDWIKFTQTITRSDVNNQFTGMISATNISAGVDVGTTSSAWNQSTADGSWGGSMNAAFRVLGNSGATTLEIDQFAVSLIEGEPPPVETNTPPVITTDPIHILIDPEVTVSIDGHTELNRQQFFNLSDAGKSFESKVDSAPQVSYYVNELGMSFGRELGGAYGVTGWNTQAVQEDPTRPGYVDMANLASKLSGNNGGSSVGFMNSFSPNLDIAQHDRYGMVPSFMPTWVGDHATENVNHKNPVNNDAYAEYVAGVLEYGYTDWTRPATYEIVNEPHWITWGDQRFADLHIAVKDAVNSNGLDVAVGGPCMSVGYFYKNNYQAFNMKGFIDNTACDLDFYSFHVYDYMSWDPASTDFVGRVSTGLPIEGVLDLIQNYTVETYDKNIDIVLSEHGGYISNGQEDALDAVANAYFPGSGFEWELERRSVSEFIAVSSAIANTMTFMNHPHVVRKAVPFILLESASWDPDYYSTLLVKDNFDKNSDVWHESTYVNFFKYFKDVAGRRVRVLNDDPDLQCHAYVDGTKLFFLVNNLSTKPEKLALHLPEEGVAEMRLRRFGRQADFRPYYYEVPITTLENMYVDSRESIVVVVDYAAPILERSVCDEVPYYATSYQQQFTGTRSFSLAVPEFATARDAILRIGVGRAPGTDRDLTVLLNDVSLDVPMEDCAAYLEGGSEYGSTKLIRVPADLLQADNTVRVIFPNNGSGGVGSVTIRAVLESSNDGAVYSDFVLAHGLKGADRARDADTDGDGLNTWAEFMAGTDPTDATSTFQIAGDVDAGSARISFETLPQRFYSVDVTDSLVTPWTELTNGMSGTGAPMELSDAGIISNRFYRVRVEM